MKKFLYTIVLLLFAASIGYSQVTTLWEKSETAVTKPYWEAGSTTRGLSYGLVNSNHRLYVVNRHADFGGKQIFVFNAATGDSVTALDTTGLAGGFYPVNDVEVSSNGIIYVGNMTLDATTTAFKVYAYSSEVAAPIEVITYTSPSAMRLGDKITVTGSTADNTVTIWAAAANATGDVVKFTTTDNGATFTPEIVNIGVLVSFSSAAVGPLANGDFYFNAHGMTPQKFTSTGTLIGTIPSTAITTSGSALRHLFTFLGDEYVVANDLFTTTSNNAKIIKVPGSVPASATLFASTPMLGLTSAGGLGDVSVQKVSDYIYNVYVLATNNGFGAYQVDMTPQLAGDYYIGAAGTGPGATDPEFATLRDAFEVLNNATFTGDCNFYITSDILETFTPVVGYGLGLAINPEPYTVTFKPYTGVQPVVKLAYPIDGTSGPSGALIIGIPMDNNIAWNDLRITKNIVIDGSNTVDGTTRDLTIECDTSANRNAFPLAIVGDVSNLTVKNTNIYYKAKGISTSGNLFVSAVQVRSRNNLAVDYIPQDILFENNHISANFPGVAQNAQGYGTYQSGDPISYYPYNITLKDNLIEGKRRAISLYIAGGHNIFGNEIVLNQDIAGGFSNEAIYGVSVETGAEINIYNNVISKVSGLNTTATFGNTAISIETAGTYNIYNNTITGFALTGTNPTSFVRALKNSSATATVNFVYNTILMNDLADVGTGVVTYQGLFLTDGINDVVNNIIVSEEPDFPSYCIYRSGVAGTVTSDYNDFYPVDVTNGNVGYWNDAATLTLSDWQTASSLDANSISKEVFFVSDTDLHLTGSSDGDFDLAGTPIAGITTDIDGDTRGTTYPYIGADEGTVLLTEPVDFWVEDFDYPADDLLTDHGWIAHSGAGTNPITVNSFGLEFPGYPASGIGLAALLDNTGEDTHKLFPATTSGSVYTSFMVRIDAAPTGYFFHYAPNPHNTFDFRGRVWVKTDGAGGLAIGYSFQSADTIFTDFDYSLGDTLLLVSKYESVPGDVNDVVSLFIFDASSPLSATEPGTPTLGPITNPNTGSADIEAGSINLRQYNSAQIMIVDGIAVQTSWDQVVPVEPEDKTVMPSTFALSQNYPNPFNPSTTIRYDLPEAGFVDLRVYNSLGEEVAVLVNQEQVSGVYEVSFDASMLASGVYFYRINSGKFVTTKKMMLIK